MITYKQRCAERWNNLEKRFADAIAEHQQRGGELPKRDLNELQLLKIEIERARTERQAAKLLLETTITAKNNAKTELQAQHDVATGEARKAIKSELDKINEDLKNIREQLAVANDALQVLVDDRKEILLQERMAKNETTADDLIEITNRKTLVAAEMALRADFLQRNKNKKR
jgi:hypothetical protein